MTEEFLLKLFQYIDLAISHYDAKDSSDNGLIESIRMAEIETELCKMCEAS